MIILAKVNSRTYWAITAVTLFSALSLTIMYMVVLGQDIRIYAVLIFICLAIGVSAVVVALDGEKEFSVDDEKIVFTHNGRTEAIFWREVVSYTIAPNSLVSTSFVRITYVHSGFEDQLIVANSAFQVNLDTPAWNPETASELVSSKNRKRLPYTLAIIKLTVAEKIIKDAGLQTKILDLRNLAIFGGGLKLKNVLLKHHKQYFPQTFEFVHALSTSSEELLKGKKSL
jgi:hypothetical protein